MPQGTVLGSMIFIIYVNDIYEEISKYEKIISQADDTVLLFKAIFY